MSTTVFLHPPDVLVGGVRPPGHPLHLPYVCARTGKTCLDALPSNDQEVQECAAALARFQWRRRSSHGQ